MVPTFALIAAAYILSRPELRRVMPWQSVAAFALIAATLLVLFYEGRFK